MKKIYWLAIFLAFPTILLAQIAISHPINRAVYQRNSSDNATVTIAGQFLGSAPANYRIEYQLDKLDVASGSYTSTSVSWTSIVSNPSFGIYNTSITVSKGWYKLYVRAYNINTSSIINSGDIKFGVGDVFLIAGQSNAQGVPDSPWSYPADSPNEGVVSINLDDNCNLNLPAYPLFSTLSTTNKIAPSGHSSWNWLRTGNQLSNNSGAPVAFFNCAYGGSTVENWEQSSYGSATTSKYTGVQYCGTGKQGMPFKSLENTSVFYVPFFGAKAGLWHQGEADNDQSTSTVTSTYVYAQRLGNFLNQARSVVGESQFSWLISRASYNGNNGSGLEINSNVIAGQNYIITGGAYDYNGPSTDDMTSSYRSLSDLVHFREDRAGALTELGDRWQSSINAASYTIVSALTPPAITVSKSGSTYTLSAPSGQSEYRWVNASNLDINSSVNNTQTYSVTSGSYACYVRNSNNKWTLTPTFSTSCGSCREAFKDWDESEVGLETNFYPNPTKNEITVSFSIPTNSQVKLDILNVEGQIIKSVFDEVKPKGKYTYPINMSDLPDALYLYRITINGLAITKKVTKIN